MVDRRQTGALRATLRFSTVDFVGLASGVMLVLVASTLHWTVGPVLSDHFEAVGPALPALTGAVIDGRAGSLPVAAYPLPTTRLS